LKQELEEEGPMSILDVEKKLKEEEKKECTANEICFVAHPFQKWQQQRQQR